MRLPPIALVALLGAAPTLSAPPLSAQAVPRAIAADPARDTANPARMEVLHIPSGGVSINGVAYVAAGAGAHPTLLLLHGFPGNEQNLDLAQAVRRAGWNVVTFHYRGSWGSPGDYRFAQNLEDADAALAFLRDGAHARALGVDTARLVLAGHSMGGWVTALTAAHDHHLRGAILISAADMGLLGTMSRDPLVAFMSQNMESLAGVTPADLAHQLLAAPAAWRFASVAAGLAATPMLVVTADDGIAGHSDRLVEAARAAGNDRVSTLHIATDHSYSDARIALEAAVLRWLDALR